MFKEGLHSYETRHGSFWRWKWKIFSELTWEEGNHMFLLCQEKVMTFNHPD